MALEKMTDKQVAYWTKKQLTWWQGACLICEFLPPETLPEFLTELNENKELQEIVSLMRNSPDCPVKVPDFSMLN